MVEPIKTPVLPEDSKTQYYRDSGSFVYHQKLISLGYFYNSAGQLRKVSDPSQGFQMISKENYELVAGIIINFVQELLKNSLKLKEIFLPLDKSPDKKKVNIFMTRIFMQIPLNR